MVAGVELGELSGVAVVVADVGTADCTGRKCWIWAQKAEMPWPSFGFTVDFEFPPESQLWTNMRWL